MLSQIDSVVDCLQAGALGEWWRGGSEETKRAGVLKAADGFFELNLASNFDGTEDDGTTIHGVISGVPVTLADCARFSRLIEKYNATTAFVGVHAAPPWPKVAACLRRSPKLTRLCS